MGMILTGTYPTGNFLSPYAGRLQIALTGVYTRSTFGDAGFRYTTAGGNITVKPYGGVPRVYGALFDKSSTLVTLELNYPGGNVIWPVGVEAVSNDDPTGGGIWSYQLAMTLTCRLYKR